MMRRLVALAVFAIAMGFGLVAKAEQDEYDPAKVSDSLKAIFQFGSAALRCADDLPQSDDGNTPL